MKLDTVIIYTQRMVALAAFYRAGLAIAAEPQAHGDNHLGFRLPNIYLGFDHVTDVPPGSAVSLWFDVPDLQAAFDRFVAAGARVRYPPTRKAMGDVLASLRDPDGNILGLVQRLAPGESE